ncbi:MAG: Bug family tripartite tricarboxylate transporter substrate binding protein [Limnohabitans sp.]
MMDLNRRKRRTLATLLALLSGGVMAANANTVKSRKLLVGGSVGGGIDPVMRRLKIQLEALQAGLFDIDFVPGGGGMSAINRLLAESADSHSVLIATSGALCITPVVAKIEGFNPEQDLVPLAILGKVPFVLFTSADSGFTSFGEMVRQFSSGARMLDYGVIPIYGANHIGGHALLQRLGIAGRAVPYKQASQLALDVAEGRVAIGIHTQGAIKGLVEQRKLRPLAVFAHKRLATLPDVPTLKELGLAEQIYEGWFGIFHRKDLPAADSVQLRGALRRIFQHKEVLINLEELGYLNTYKDTQDAATFFGNEIARYKKILAQMDLSQS